MLDPYVYGQVERVSPEAPIPILRVARETYTPDGAGEEVVGEDLVQFYGGKIDLADLIGRP
jgi:D-beta-D-heptose 7-phosphate kinase/D-beta-D-heptose 1-phosphate adenosyltransferase